MVWMTFTQFSKIDIFSITFHRRRSMSLSKKISSLNANFYLKCNYFDVAEWDLEYRWIFAPFFASSVSRKRKKISCQITFILLIIMGALLWACKFFRLFLPSLTPLIFSITRVQWHIFKMYYAWIRIIAFIYRKSVDEYEKFIKILMQLNFEEFFILTCWHTHNFQPLM